MMCLNPWSELPDLILKGVKKSKNFVASDFHSAFETLQSEYIFKRREPMHGWLKIGTAVWARQRTRVYF